MRCHILQRSHFATYHLLHDLPDISVDDRTIVMGIPTTSRTTKQIYDHPIRQILFPNVAGTAKANPHLKFVLLVAFDAKDRFLDNPITRRELQFDHDIPNLRIFFIRLIKTRSVVMIWNVLFDIAMRAGARYFYQLNDDITFDSHDWPDAFIRAIDSENGHGVVGPNDVLRRCNLLTQNFVGRGHWTIFGFLFPPDFWNWWSDNWLGEIYRLYGLRKCFSEHRIVNGQRKDGSACRYQACRSVEYEALVAFYADKIERFFTPGPGRLH